MDKHLSVASSWRYYDVPTTPKGPFLSNLILHLHQVRVGTSAKDDELITHGRRIAAVAIPGLSQASGRLGREIYAVFQRVN